MLEADLREQRLVDRVPCRNFKKRHLKDLSEQEVDDIVALTQQPGWLKKNVAQKYRVSDMLISRICREAEREPEKMLRRRGRRQLQEDKKDSIENVVGSMLQANVPIVRAQQVQLAVKEQMHLDVNTKLVCSVMRKDLGMGYRMAKKVPIQSNLERQLVLR